jgi:hypothetical protein
MDGLPFVKRIERSRPRFFRPRTGDGERELSLQNIYRVPGGLVGLRKPRLPQSAFNRRSIYGVIEAQVAGRRADA